MKRIPKGHYGYLDARKKQLLIRALILLAGAAALVITGIAVTGSRLNWMTVFGALTAVPMAMQFATFFSLAAYRTRPEDEYREIREITGNGVLDTDLVIANPKGAGYQAAYAYFHEEGVFIYTPDLKTDLHEMEQYIRNYLRLNGCDGPLTVYDSLQTFEKRLKSLTASDRAEVPEKILSQEGVLRAIAM